MTITREQVADLRPGDVVELHFTDGYDVERTYRGALRESGGLLYLAHLSLRGPDGEPRRRDGTLTVVSRAPRLYVNHDREKPKSGDVVRDADDQDSPLSWNCVHGTWYGPDGISISRSDMPARLRLLVDGETGRCVP